MNAWKSASFPAVCRGLVLVGWAMGLLAGCREGERPAPRAEAEEAPASQAAADPESPERIATKTGIEMVRLPGGAFLMGADDGEEDEKPPRRVELSPFYIDVHEVTQATFQRLMGKNPSRFADPEKPVERIGWLAAMQFCNVRSLKEGLKPCYDPKTLVCDFAADGYRLPTEAEWEYACRAGTTGRWSFGSDGGKLALHAWFKANAQKSTHAVKRKLPNPWGLYDMHGNVAEWCNDHYEEGYEHAGVKDPRGPAGGDERVLRGGSWTASDDACRSSARGSAAPGLTDVCFGYDAYGFRCVRAAGSRR
jgi:formylglycine-generating enzyme required for sulfatase activity